MNIQHLESLNDQIRHITSITVRETIPDWIVQKADEVVMVDLTPRALLHRLERGVVYQPEQAQRALQNFFREPTLVALRELALREAAHEVGQRLTSDEDSRQHGDHKTAAAVIQPKILVYVTTDPKTVMVIRRAKRVSDFLGGECLAVAVERAGNLDDRQAFDREALRKHLNFARNLHIETQVLEGEAASAVVDFARQNRITQIFVTRPHGRAWLRVTSGDPIQKIIDLAKDMQIVIVSDREPVGRR